METQVLDRAKFWVERWIVCIVDSRRWTAEIDGVTFPVDEDGFIVLGKESRARLYNVEYFGRP